VDSIDPGGDNKAINGGANRKSCMQIKAKGRELADKFHSLETIVEVSAHYLSGSG
jgi:hypothetical protein